jgi:5-methylcytosine-specific restriction protein A
MSTNRTNPKAGFCNSALLPKGPNGRSLCRRCQTEVPKGKRTFCSKKCIEEWRLTSDPTFLRRRVFKRDQGRCAECGLDTKELEAAVRTIRRLAHGRHAERFQGLQDLHRQLIALLKAGPHRDSFWDADHVLEVVNGGGECGLDNIQTLCVWCHKAKTSRLAQARAARSSTP